MKIGNKAIEPKQKMAINLTIKGKGNFLEEVRFANILSSGKAYFNKVFSSDKNIIVGDTVRRKKGRDCRLLFFDNDFSFLREVKFKNSLRDISISKETGFVGVRCYDRNLYLLDFQGNLVLTVPLKPFGVGATKYTRGNFRSLFLSNNGQYLVFSVENKFMVFDIKNRCILGAGKTFVSFQDLSENIAKSINYFGDWIYASAIDSCGTIFFGTYSGRLAVIKKDGIFEKTDNRSLLRKTAITKQKDRKFYIQFPKQDIPICRENRCQKMNAPVYHIIPDEENKSCLVYVGNLIYLLSYSENKLSIIKEYKTQELGCCIFYKPSLSIFFMKGLLRLVSNERALKVLLPKVFTDATFQKNKRRLILLRKEGLYTIAPSKIRNMPDSILLMNLWPSSVFKA